ncbi:hypothetical protein DWB85_18590 [Seongchinamella sediminis]|uniref:Endonuclease GajA/Old nuclease/RecF-like AAA domain-containing protein n=1 Tax=Seongchinamella sediminis TaxID=2283635 RepID=A0A3L7DWD1_9GAMM|nr:AAA family ATPase [Seongchinamella sediminis]RLQ20251.1 hypothetical protein DWB85_18590 [Seongchinamella sediminis]
MKIEQIKINNFRQFHGLTEVEFSTDPKKNVTVVHGANGSGKTSLLNAFKWCFYGKTDFDTGNDSILNEAAIEISNLNENITLEVAVKFSHENLRYQATRRQIFRKEASLKAVATGEDVFSLDVTKSDGQTIRSRSPLSEMLAILPDNLQPYFFFNGERIEKLAGTNHSAQIQDAIKNLMGLELVERAISHLGKAKSSYRKDIKKYATEEEGLLQEEIARLEEDERRYTDKIKAAVRSREEAESELVSIDTELRSFDKSKELQEKRSDLEKQSLEKLQEIDRIVAKQKQLIAESGFLTLCDDVVAKSIKIVEENRKKGVLPYRIKEQFIDDLIGLKQCICGTSIVEGSKEHKCLVDAKQQAGSEDLEASFTRVSALLNDHEDTKKRFSRDYAELARQLLHTENQKEDLSSRIADISARLSSFNDRRIAELEAQHATFRSTRDRALQDEGVAIQERNDCRSALIEKNTYLARLEGQRGKASLVQRKIDTAETVGKAFEDLYESLADHVRDDLSKRVNDTFQSIIRKPVKAIIDTDYRLQIVKQTSDGHDYVVSEQSTGERQVTSLSFISSIIALAREQHAKKTTFFQGGLYPLVMDSPFGALDDDYREKVAESVSELAEQVIMFVSNSQWSGRVKAACEAKVGKSYKLVYYSPVSDIVDGEYVRETDATYEYTTIEDAS